MADDRLVGQTLGHYTIESVVGRGGMGVVYRARDTKLGRVVALKVLAEARGSDAAYRNRFLRESRLLASIDHPNIVPVYEADEADGQLYIAMRFVEGLELRQIIERDGPLAPARAVGIIAQVADALDAAHAKGLVHRDVKPGNILILAGSTNDYAYLTDFGLTKQAGETTGLTQTGTFVGTPGYVAPEQIRGTKVDHRADVYALGCVLYDALTGSVPFPRDSTMASLWAHVHERPPAPSKTRAGLTPAFDPVIAKALAKRPGDRYQTAGGLAQAARAALVGGDVQLATTVVGGQAIRVSAGERKKAAAAAAGVGGAAAADGAADLVITGGGPTPPLADAGLASTIGGGVGPTPPLADAGLASTIGGGVGPTPPLADAGLASTIGGGVGPTPPVADAGLASTIGGGGGPTPPVADAGLASTIGGGGGPDRPPKPPSDRSARGPDGSGPRMPRRPVIAVIGAIALVLVLVGGVLGTSLLRGAGATQSPGTSASLQALVATLPPTFVLPSAPTVVVSSAPESVVPTTVPTPPPTHKPTPPPTHKPTPPPTHKPTATPDHAPQVKSSCLSVGFSTTLPASKGPTWEIDVYQSCFTDADGDKLTLSAINLNPGTFGTSKPCETPGGPWFCFIYNAKVGWDGTSAYSASFQFWAHDPSKEQSQHETWSLCVGCAP